MYRDFFERLLRAIQTKRAWELHAAIRIMVEIYCLLSLCWEQYKQNVLGSCMQLSE